MIKHAERPIRPGMKKPKWKTAGEARFAKMVARKHPSFLCVAGDDERELLRNYFFERLYFYDPAITCFRLHLRKRTLRVDNGAESAELSTVLFLLNFLLPAADAKQKRYASGLIDIYGYMDIMDMNLEKDFNDMGLLLAFLSKMAWELCGRDIEEFMKNLDALVMEPSYW